MWEPRATASTFVELQSTWLGEVAKSYSLKVTHQVEVVVVPDVRGVQDSLRSLVMSPWWSWCSVENSLNQQFFWKKRALFQLKNRQKTGEIRIFLLKKTGALKFCFSFFLAVFTVLQVHPKTRLSITWPRERLLLWFMRFTVINYLQGWIDVKCWQSHKKTGKITKKRAKTGDFPKTPV